MATLALLILGLAGLTLPAEAAKRPTEHGVLITDTLGFLGRASGATANKSSGTAEKIYFFKRSLVSDEGESLDDRSGDFTEDACSELCAAKAECKSFTFKPKNNKSEAWCHLKPKCVDTKTPEKLFPVDLFSTFYKTYVNMTWTERPLVADEGNSLSHHEGIDLVMCQKECHSNEKCNSISFGGGWCHLKDKCVTAKDTKSITQFASFMTTYYLACGSESDTWHQRSLVANEGVLLAEVSLSLLDCQIKCDGDPMCNSISYQQDSGTCRLHDKAVTKADDASNAAHTVYHTYYRPC